MRQAAIHLEQTMTESDEEPMYTSMEELILDWRRKNEISAAAMVQQLVAQLAADGDHLAPGMAEALELRTLKAMNSRLEQDMAAVSARMADEAPEAPAPVLH
jgi:hypothetical protein